MSDPANTSEASPSENMRAPAEAAGIPVAGAIRLIARIWRGRTLATVVDDYTNYLYENGIRTIASIPGNRGVQML